MTDAAVSTGRRGSLTLVVAGSGLLVVAAVLAGEVGSLAAAGALTATVAAATLIPTGVVILTVLVLAVIAVRRLAHRLRALRLAALAEPGDLTGLTAPGDPARLGELGDLAGAIDALRVRMRLATELASRRDRDAVTASAGMFQLLGGLVAAEEGARGQLAAELHDTVAQSLARARSLLTEGRSDEAADLVSEAEDQTRAIMARTRPPALVEGDLAEAVTVLQDDLLARYGLEVVLTWPEHPRPLPMATAVTVYRFFQEGLLNVVKHCEASQARVSLSFDGEMVLARVADDGPGFEPGAVRPDRGRHVGLGLLSERARLAGGRLAVSSAPGAGTVLTLELPAPDPASGTRRAPDLAAVSTAALLAG